MKVNLRNQFILVLLLVIFITPTLLGTLLYCYPQWLKANTTNQGQLLAPPISLQALEQSEKWQIVLWSPTVCQQACSKQLKQLTQVALALGRQFYQVQITLLQPPLSAADQNALHTYTTPTLFIADPNHSLILTYPAHNSSEALFHDLKHLLSINPNREQAHVFPSN